MDPAPPATYDGGGAATAAALLPPTTANGRDANGHAHKHDHQTMADAQFAELVRMSLQATYPQDEGKSSKVVDLHEDLGQEDKLLVLHHALGVGDGQRDAEEFYTKTRARFDRVNLELPTVEVRFKDLRVETTVYAEQGRNLPTILNVYRRALEWLVVRVLPPLRPARKDMVILNNLSGVLKPGRATLLLGPPQGGKSTLLKALAGKLSPDGLKINGEVTYNGRTFKEFLPQRTAVYVEQEDSHMPELTVRETLDFAARFQGVGQKAALLEELRRREKELGLEPDWHINAYMKLEALQGSRASITTDFVLRMLGLDICADTELGNAMRRGVSGGQKKRVTTGEMIVGGKKVLMMDEISTGLDSSTTYEIIKFLRDQTHLTEATTVIALLQPAPETYDLFDDIILLADGYIVYQGPREHVEEFFESLGFKCPERKGVADFLQEVTSRKDQKQYWAHPRQPYRFVSVADMAEQFRDFRVGQAISEELAQPAPSSEVSGKHEHREAILTQRKYALTPMQLWNACMEREIMLVKRNMFIYCFRFIVTNFMAIVVATTFLRTEISPSSVVEGNLYFGVVFFSLIMVMFDGFAEETLTVQRLPGWYKQRDNLFYPAWAYVFPTTLLRIPYSLIVSGLWTFIVYYTVGLAPEASRFFMFWLLLFLLHSFGISMFRLLASICRNETVASTGGSFFFLVLLLLGGFLLSKDNIPDWWIWFYWINPVSYAQQAIAINEFSAPRWQTQFTETIPPQSFGDVILGQRGLYTDYWWVWLGVGTTVFSIILFNILTWICHAYLDSLDSVTATLREEQGAAAPGDANDDASSAAALSSKTLPASRKSLDVPVSRKSLDVPVAVPESGDIEAGHIPASPTPAAGAPPLTSSQRQISLSKLMEQRAAAEAANGGSNPASRRSLTRTSMGSEDGARTGGKGMVLPFTPLCLTFHELNYYVDLPKEVSTDPEKLGPRTADVHGRKMLQLLRNCSGAFRPGVLTALVGSSGAGKTTLMDVLAGRKTTGIIEGDIQVSGYPKVQETFARVSGYCEQTDIHSPTITVHESLVYSARLRFSTDVEQEIVFAFVQEVMELVELEGLANSIVGRPGHSGLSVEQRKRLTIAVELVANPSIVFMDEPTSGLDARAAAIVMRTVRNTVNTGRTVVCTIHQPSIDIFEAFDDLLLMKSGGNIIYHGRLGKRSHRLIDYFQAIPGVPPLAEGLNPATWMLQISTAGMEANIGKDFAEIYRASTLFQRNEELIAKLNVAPEGSAPLKFETKYPQSYLTQFRLILWKFWMGYWRNAPYNGTRFIFAAMLALLTGSILWDVGGAYSSPISNVQDVGNILGALYLSVLFLGIINSRTVQPVADEERSVMYRERAAGMYSELPFAVAQCAVEVPYNLLQAIIFSVIAYFLMGFALSAAKFFWFLLMIFLTLNLMVFYGIMGVYVTPALALATVLSGFFYGFWNLFAGFIIPLTSIPWWWRWYWYANPIAWGLYGIIVTQLGDLTNEITFPGSTEPITVKQYLEDSFGYRHDFIGEVVAILLGFIAFFAILAIGCLKYFNFQKR